MIDTSWNENRDFKIEEARQLLALCIDLNDPEAKQTITEWRQVFPQGQLKSVGPFDNAWKLWQKVGDPKTFAIAIRGTIASRDSILDDVIATSIKAEVRIQAQVDSYLAFRMAERPKAELHLGFTLALAALLFDKDGGILDALRDHLPPGARLYITGHSQGAAVATLLHAFLHYALNDPEETRRYLPAGADYKLKSYVFAQPKPGNWQFAMDFARIAGSRGVSFTINNDLDWVPQVPLAIEFLDEPGRGLLEQLEKSENGARRALVRMFLGTNILLAQGARGVVALTSEDLSVRQFLQEDVTLDPRFLQPGRVVNGDKRAISINYAPVGNLVPVFGSALGDLYSIDGPLAQHHATNYRVLLKQLDSAR